MDRESILKGLSIPDSACDDGDSDLDDDIADLFRDPRSSSGWTMASSSECSSSSASSAQAVPVTDHDKRRLEDDRPKYPDMSSESLMTFYTQIVPQLLQVSSSGDEDDSSEELQVVSSSSSSAHSGIAPGSTSLGSSTEHPSIAEMCLRETERRDRRTFRQREQERMRRIGRAELKELEYEMEIDARVAERGTLRPDVFRDVVSMEPFSIIVENWIPPLLSDPAVETVFLYLQCISCAGLGAVNADVDSTVYFLESIGMTIEKGDVSEQVLTYRAFFTPMTLMHGADTASRRTDSAGSSSAASQFRETVISTRRIPLDTDEGGRASLASKLQVLHSRAIEEDPLQAFKSTRHRALKDEKPLHFSWDTTYSKRPFNLAELARTKARQILTAVKQMESVGADEEDDPSDSDVDDVDDDSSLSSDSSDIDEGPADSGVSLGERERALPVRETDQSVYDVLSRGIQKKMLSSMRRMAHRVQSQNPDSIAKATGELSGWIEDCLCVDIVIFPGIKNVLAGPERIDRQLKFAFGMCAQNPYATSELIKKVGVPAREPK